MFQRRVSAPLSKVFSDASDPRIAFFQDVLSPEDLKTAVNLRELLFAGTSFTQLKMDLNSTAVSLANITTRDHQIIPGEKRPALAALCQIFSAAQPKPRRLLSHSFLREKGHSYDVSRRLLKLFVHGLGVWCGFFAIALKKDAEHRAISKTAFAEGKCQWTIDGCKGSYGTRKDCYLPEDICTPEGILAALTIVVALVAFVLWTRAVKTERGALLGQLLAHELNECPTYDSLLNRLCEQRGCPSPSNWSAKVYIGADEYSLRSISLFALASFDHHLYPKIFSELIPACTKGEVLFFGAIKLDPVPQAAIPAPVYQGLPRAVVETAQGLAMSL